MQTESENLVTQISSGIFFKEFTFDKNDFYPDDGKKELADNILWLDHLLFVIQIKERNLGAIKSELEENKWFNSTVILQAKKQIAASVAYFTKYPEIKIKNVRGHELDISGADLSQMNKIIIYKPNSSLIDRFNRYRKFYESSENGNIHLFHVEDYYWICKFLHTPTELDEYLKFRERIYTLHKKIINIYPEQYMLAHFLNTPNESIIDEQYIEMLPKLMNDIDDFDVSFIIENFQKNLIREEDKSPSKYYYILKEIAKLKRYELKEFKKRFREVILNVNENKFSFPLRFVNSRSECGFVFISLINDTEQWQTALENFTEIYKYKRKLRKCLGVIVFKSGEYRDIYWAYYDNEWEYNEEMETILKTEEGFYSSGKIQQFERYKFDEDNKGQ